MKKCEMCPRKCEVNRECEFGFCGEKTLRVSHVMLHHWEEPIVSGCEKDKGSGTIFFSGCNLKCVYCQNYEISSDGEGKVISVNELVEIFKKLERAGALNINLVTPTHFSGFIIEALNLYKPAIPVVWNTSGYESEETIEKLKGLVDVFLTDIKYYSPSLSKKYSSAEDYFEQASKAVLKMRKIVGEDKIENGLIKRGIIVRHLVLPNCTSDSVKVLEWVKENLGENSIVSIMNQYVPCAKVKDYAEINRKVTPIEYSRVVKRAQSLGFSNAFIQDDTSSSSDYIPSFKGDKPFGY